LTRRIQASLVWVLMVALPVYGGSGVLLHLLGAPHRHQAVETVDESAPLVDTLLARVLGESTMELVAQFKARTAFVSPHKVHRHTPGTPEHSHGLFERHHHDAGDDSVVALGALTPGGDLSGDAASAAVGSATLALGLTGSFVFPVQKSVAGPWPVAHDGPWRDLKHVPPERPPRGAPFSAPLGRVTAAA
jgi:hypothetical protein